MKGDVVLSFNIIGTGSSCPKKVVTNDDLVTFLDTSDEWITTRTGVKARRVCNDEKINDLAVESTKQALENAKIEAKNLDLIICATMGGDFVTPSTACCIQKEIGATCPAFDINAACSGFIYALDIANSYFCREGINNILVVVAENMTKYLDWTDRGTCVLFGDATAAVVLGRGDGLKAIRLAARGNSEVLNINNNDSNTPWQNNENEKRYLHMNGQEVFKFAVNAMVKDVRNLLKEANIAEEDVNVMLPHQANIRIIDNAKQKLNIPLESYYTNIERYGNTSAACIPVLLDELNKGNKLKKGDIIVMSAFGGGLTSGACIIEW